MDVEIENVPAKMPGWAKNDVDLSSCFAFIIYTSLLLLLLVLSSPLESVSNTPIPLSGGADSTF